MKAGSLRRGGDFRSRPRLRPNPAQPVALNAPFYSVFQKNAILDFTFMANDLPEKASSDFFESEKQKKLKNSIFLIDIEDLNFVITVKLLTKTVREEENPCLKVFCC